MKKPIKKTLAFIIASVMLITAIPLTAGAATEYTSGYYTYEVENSEAIITDVDSSISGDITIPSTLGGYPVTAIGHKSFYNCDYISSVIIPDNIKYIYGYSFDSCDSLESVTIYNALIYDYAFNYCYNLKTVTTSAGVTKLAYKMFYQCTAIETFVLGPNISSLNVGQGGYSNLSEFIVDSNNPYFSADVNGVLFNKDKTKIIQFPEANPLTSSV